VIKRRVLQGGKTLSIDSMELAVSESEVYLDIMTAFMPKVREGRKALSTCTPKKEIEKLEQWLIRQ
jgi:hypothetical protein